MLTTIYMLAVLLSTSVRAATLDLCHCEGSIQTNCCKNACSYKQECDLCCGGMFDGPRYSECIAFCCVLPYQ